jgi:hypothetical protein
MPCVWLYFLTLNHILRSGVILVLWMDRTPVYQEGIVSMAMFTHMGENVVCAHKIDVGG